MKIENVIYILTNPQYPGYIKIGYASDLKQRLSSLNTGTLVEFIPYAVYETPKDKADIEIHKIIELLNPVLRASKIDNGKSKLKEFFKLDPEEAYELFQHIAIVSGTKNHLYKIDSNLNRINNIEKQKTKNQLPDGYYYLQRKNRKNNMLIKAAVEVQNGQIILKSGSYINLAENSIPNKIRNIRKTLNVKDNILQEDFACTLSEASMIILGTTCNVWTNWRNEKGEFIDIYRY